MINVEDACRFEIACNQISANEFFVRHTRTPEIVLEITLPEVAPEFGKANLLEAQVQRQPFDCLVDLVDRNAIPGQVAKCGDKHSIRKKCTHSMA